jgi:hypothetical protein
MNIHDHEIENTLRHAPQPKPPSGLKERLIAQVGLTRTNLPLISPGDVPGVRGWLQRWWPTLAPATLSLACAAMLTYQHLEIQDLQGNLQALAQAVAAQEKSTVAAANPAADDSAAASSAHEQQEIDRLQQMASRLRTEVKQMEQKQMDNAKLRTQLSTIPANAPAEFQQDLAALEEAKAKAQRIACVNNLKQLGLAVRVWATDNSDRFPPDILSMTNEMSTPKILVCPADTGRTTASSWATYTAAQCSYQYLGATASDKEPNRVMWICPIHGNVTLCDGSVQQQIYKTHPEQFSQQNGGIYLEPINPHNGGVYPNPINSPKPFAPQP